MNRVYQPKVYDDSKLTGVSGVYQIRNLVNNKIYIGSSKNLKHRKNHDHISTLKKNKHQNAHLQNAFNKYGEKNFVFEIIEFCEEKELKDIEQYWLDRLGAYKREVGYNIAINTFNHEFSEETKQKMSKNHANFKGENNPMYGKCGELAPFYGRVGKLHHASKRVMCIETGVIYESVRQAERMTKIQNSNISACCLGKYRHKTAGGYHWKYLDN